MYAFTLFIDFSIVYDVDSAVLYFQRWFSDNGSTRSSVIQTLGTYYLCYFKDLSAMAARKEKGPNSAADSFCDPGQTA